MRAVIPRRHDHAVAESLQALQRSRVPVVFKHIGENQRRHAAPFAKRVDFFQNVQKQLDGVEVIFARVAHQRVRFVQPDVDETAARMRVQNLLEQAEDKLFRVRIKDVESTRILQIEREMPPFLPAKNPFQMSQTLLKWNHFQIQIGGFVQKILQSFARPFFFWRNGKLDALKWKNVFVFDEYSVKAACRNVFQQLR